MRLVIDTEDEEKRLLESLPYATSATFNCYDCQNQSECLPNTRTALLAEIMAWVGRASPTAPEALPSRATAKEGKEEHARRVAHDSGGGRGDAERIYWLDGMAGTGKSTIARTVTRRCSNAGCLGASFFFSRGGGELETARKFVTSVAVQQARRSSPLRRHMCKAVRAHPDIAMLVLRDQWRQLVLKPFELAGAALGDTPPLVLVVDALDECQDAAEIDVVLRLLCDMSSRATCRLLTFLTSRPEIPVRMGLADKGQARHRHIILHHVDRSVVDRDINEFLRHTLEVIRRESCLAPGWPAQESIERLVQRAGGLFIWTATICRYVRSGRHFASQRLAEVLAESCSVSPTAESGLDEVYLICLA